MVLSGANPQFPAPHTPSNPSAPASDDEEVENLRQAPQRGGEERGTHPWGHQRGHCDPPEPPHSPSDPNKRSTMKLCELLSVASD